LSWLNFSTWSKKKKKSFALLSPTPLICKNANYFPMAQKNHIRRGNLRAKKSRQKPRGEIFTQGVKTPPSVEVSTYGKTGITP